MMHLKTKYKRGLVFLKNHEITKLLSYDLSPLKNLSPSKKSKALGLPWENLTIPALSTVDYLVCLANQKQLGMVRKQAGPEMTTHAFKLSDLD